MTSGIKARITKVAASLALFAVISSVRARTPVTTSEQPLYISAAAIHRVMLKPHSQFWRFEHLDMNTANAQNQML